MAQKTRAELQSIWVTGATMTEAIFDDVWDSFHNKLDDSYPSHTLNEVLNVGNTAGTDIDMSNNAVSDVSSISFNSAGATQGPGILSWNDTDGTLDLGLKGGNVTLQIGLEQVIRVVNKSGGDLLESNFNAVRIRLSNEGGAQGQRLAVVKAQGDSDPDSATTIGIVTETIADNQEGYITTFGYVRNINTTDTGPYGESWSDGDVLYLSPTTPGAITNVKPTAPQHTVILGYVVYAHQNNGIIFVKVDNGYELNELHDVYYTTLNDKDRLSWDASNSRWTNTPPQDLAYRSIGSTASLSTTSERLFVNHTSPITITGPTSPTVNSVYEIVDSGGNCTANPITFDGNGFLIRGSSTWTMDADWYVLKIVFNGSSYNII